ncbi:SET and MYND domain-containing protein 4 [Microplitis demolitor]|uniref:SET and MYND domain-containing protein 4 n=1 Tax=Microplitis demolitor TaxID=69319 RepID=UPI0006D4F781|nr:SET and MYND domain-containing protein 4 [Microplitis demolitor]
MAEAKSFPLAIVKISVDNDIPEDLKNQEEIMAYMLGCMTVTDIPELYSKAIAFAPLGSHELARAYSDRSVALFNKGYYEDCLKDIERASQIGYPNELKTELYTRQAKALWAIKPIMRPEVQKAITKAQCWMSEIDETSQQKIKTSLSLLLKNYSLNASFTHYDFSKFLPPTPQDNPQIVGASSAIELKYSENYGRHIVATKDIKVGEVVFVQKAYALINSRHLWYSYCWYCSKRTWSSVSCETCVHVIYCNEDCRDKAWNEYHDMECKIISLLLSMGQCEWLDLMAVRITIKAIKEAGSLQALKNNLAKINEMSDSIEKVLTHGLHDRSEYFTVYSLVHDVSFREKSEVEGLLLSSVYILHSFASSSTLSMPFIDMKRGDSLGSFASFFNHSCFSNVCPAHYGNIMTFRVTRQVKKGEQLFISYGPNFDELPTAKRKKQLKDDYNFLCECIACRYDWNPSTIFPSLTNKSVLTEVESKIKDLIQKNDKTIVTTIQPISKSNELDSNLYTIKSLTDLLNLFCENLNYRSREMLSFKVLLESNYSNHADIHNDNAFIIKNM